MLIRVRVGFLMMSSLEGAQSGPYTGPDGQRGPRGPWVETRRALVIFCISTPLHLRLSLAGKCHTEVRVKNSLHFYNEYFSNNNTYGTYLFKCGESPLFNFQNTCQITARRFEIFKMRPHLAVKIHDENKTHHHKNTVMKTWHTPQTRLNRILHQHDVESYDKCIDYLVLCVRRRNGTKLLPDKYVCKILS